MCVTRYQPNAISSVQVCFGDQKFYPSHKCFYRWHNSISNYSLCRTLNGIIVCFALLHFHPDDNWSMQLKHQQSCCFFPSPSDNLPFICLFYTSNTSFLWWFLSCNYVGLEKMVTILRNAYCLCCCQCMSWETKMMHAGGHTELPVSSRCHCITHKPFPDFPSNTKLE